MRLAAPDCSPQTCRSTAWRGARAQSSQSRSWATSPGLRSGSSEGRHRPPFSLVQPSAWRLEVVRYLREEWIHGWSIPKWRNSVDLSQHLSPFLTQAGIKMICTRQEGNEPGCPQKRPPLDPALLSVLQDSLARPREMRGCSWGQRSKAWQTPGWQMHSSLYQSLVLGKWCCCRLSVYCIEDAVLTAQRIQKCFNS